MKFFYSILLVVIISNASTAQDTLKSISCNEFFSEELPADVVISTDLGTLLNNKNKTITTAANFSIRMPDSLQISQEVLLTPRGKFRLENCYIPPLKVNFKNKVKTTLSSFKNLKLVNGCSVGSSNDQLLLKEYLVYKMYNILCPMSYRVRLINLKIEDSKGKKKPLVLHSFFVEDLDDVAKRNKCKEWDEAKKVPTESTNRMHMTFVSIFQYMIGNTDWSVPVAHNIRLIQPKNDSMARPYAVPYDFDYSGLVNANYAVPDEQLGTTSVLERVYRGFPRTIEELKEVIVPFIENRDKIYLLINGFELLTKRNRDEMLGYLNEFYNDIKNDKDLKKLFIDNARHD